MHLPLLGTTIVSIIMACAAKGQTAFVTTYQTGPHLAGRRLTHYAAQQHVQTSHAVGQHTFSTRTAPTRLNLFGGLFGNDDAATGSDAELASFANLAKSKDDVDRAFDSLTTYLRDWAALFEGEGGKQRGLTTPVSAASFVPPKSEEEDEAENVIESAGVKIVFRPPKRYMSKDEERTLEKGQPAESGGKQDKSSPGGVAVVVQKALGGEEVRVVAKRCDTDEDTVIKEMSEGAIIQSLRDAIQVWKKERQ